MSLDKIVEKIAATDYGFEELRLRGEAVKPPSDIVALLVSVDRHARNLKQSALASLAGVSLSSVERIERGEVVSDEVLDKVTLALGRRNGDFTKPVVPLSPQETTKMLNQSAEKFNGRIWVPASPLRKLTQIAAVARAHFFWFDDVRLIGDFAEEGRVLCELFELSTFVIGQEEDECLPKKPRRDRVKRRALYREILDAASCYERNTASVLLCATYEAKIDAIAAGSIPVAAIAAYPKATDPGAIKRRQLCVPEKVDPKEVWRQLQMEPY